MKELLFRGRFKINKFRWNGTPREYEFIESKTHHISAIYFNNNGDISHVVIPYKDTCITLFPYYFTTFDIQQYTGLKEQEEAFENMPESFQESDRWERMQEFIDILEQAIDGITEAKE